MLDVQLADAHCRFAQVARQKVLLGQLVNRNLHTAS